MPVKQRPIWLILLRKEAIKINERNKPNAQIIGSGMIHK